MKIGCLCITWNQPVELGRMIRCFELQDYDDRELVVLDDSGQYGNQPRGDRWQVVSVPRRFRSIGEKRAACVGLMSSDVDAISVVDSDDVYLPWALSSCASALKSAPWAIPQVILEWDNDGKGPGWHQQETFSRNGEAPRYAYHSAWAYRIEAYCAVGGYPLGACEDWPFGNALAKRFGPPANSTADGRPWMAYSRGPSHLSSRIHAHAAAGAGKECYARAWEERASDVIKPVEDLHSLVKWDWDYLGIPVPEEVHSRPW